MTVPTLTYFNGRGRGELIRYLFVLSGAQYNDVRVDAITPELRATLPFGQLPVLDTENGRVAQTLAIARYVAAQNKLYGSNDFERALIDSYVDSVFDLVNAYRSAQDEAAKLKFKEETLPRFLNSYESHLKTTGGQFFVGSAQSFADVTVFFGLENLIRFNNLPELLSAFPTVNTFYTQFEAIPSISAHIKARATTPF
eukprot:gene3603-4127_t